MSSYSIDPGSTQQRAYPLRMFEIEPLPLGQRKLRPRSPLRINDGKTSRVAAATFLMGESATASPTVKPKVQGATAALTRTEFESAVKDALRHYTRIDLLAYNPLLRAQVILRRQPGEATPQSLQAAVAETAEVLFANPRDQRLYRVLRAAYLTPELKQATAAHKLGLPFATYRRHLTAAVSRIVAWLWREENQAAPPGHVAELKSCSAGSKSTSANHRLSLVVLPFLNLSRDSTAGFLADSITDNLPTDLWLALPGGFVITRSTAFTYKGRHVTIREVGQELRVRYVLEGSVVVDSGRARVSAQLIDAQADAHLWVERFDKECDDLLQVHDEIVARLSRSVSIQMIRREAAQSCAAGCADATDLVLCGKALFDEFRLQANAARAVSLFRQALALDPKNVDAMIGVAASLICQIFNLYETDRRAELLDEADSLISQAIDMAPENVAVLKARAALLRARGRFADAVAVIRTVLARSPAEPIAYRDLGLNKLYLGETHEAAQWLRCADRIAPADPTRWIWLQALGRTLMQLGQDADAVGVLRLAMDHNPTFHRGKALLAAAEALRGNLELAKLYIAEFNDRDPAMTIRKFVEERSSVPLDAVSPIYRRENERILEGLHLAGMPGP